MSERQTTLAEAFRFEGVGVHTGVESAISVRPAPAGSGFVFERGSARIPALSENVVDTRRATTLGLGETRISTVEHVLSALFGMGVDNATLIVEGPEVPIEDGSAGTFADAIARTGLVELDATRAILTIDEPIVIRDGETVVIALPAPQLSVRISVDHGPPIGAHTFSGTVDPASYRAEIAPARTYCSLDDAKRMHEMGLARGGSLDRALVFGESGPLTPLRWPGEPARHKALDLIGDLALLGARPRIEVVAFKSGHATHARLTAALRERWLAKRGAGIEATA
jgi:UDP-3-O-acyl N-acetylglucosamine deacetylase